MNLDKETLAKWKAIAQETLSDHETSEFLHPREVIALIDRIIELEDTDGQQKYINWLGGKLVSLGKKIKIYEEALNYYAYPPAWHKPDKTKAKAVLDYFEALKDQLF